MRDSWRPPPNPANPYFPWQLAGLAGQAADALAGEGGSFLALPGTGTTPNPVLDTARAYQISATDGLGRYSGFPVTHRDAASPTAAGTFAEDETGRHGPGCLYDGLPLVEVTGRTDVPVGSVVLAWPSPASDAMLFGGAAGLRVVPVRATTDGTPSVQAYRQVRTGAPAAWQDTGDPFFVTVLDPVRNEPFVANSVYLAFGTFASSDELFCDTGPKTACATVLDDDCNPVTIRVLARPGCGAGELEMVVSLTGPPTIGPPVGPAPRRRGSGRDGSGRNAGAASDLTGGTTTMAVYTSQLGIA
jgi:hypothetical protein